MDSIQSLDQNEENIYFLNMMHFDTVVPSSGVNKLKLVKHTNIFPFHTFNNSIVNYESIYNKKEQNEQEGTKDAVFPGVLGVIGTLTLGPPILL